YTCPTDPLLVSPFSTSRCAYPTLFSFLFFSYSYAHHPDLHSFPTRRSSDLINTILHELNPLFTINVTMRDIKSKNVYSRVNSKATTQWRKTESANGVHLEGVASDNRSS